MVHCGILSTIAIIFLHAQLVQTEDESCFMNSVNVLEGEKDYQMSSVDSQVILPRMTFSCNGAITGLTVNLTKNKENERTNTGNHTGGTQEGDNNGDDRDNDGDEEDSGEGEDNDNGDKGEEEKNDKVDEKRDTDSIKSFPSIQIWRPLTKLLYTRVGQYTICISDIKMDGNLTLAEVSLTANESISFQPQDIIGYYVPVNSPYSILNIHIMEGIFYSVNTNTTLEQFAVNESVAGSSMLPIIQVTFETVTVTAVTTDVSDHQLMTSTIMPNTAVTTSIATNIMTLPATTATTNTIASTTLMTSPSVSSDEQTSSSDSSSGIVIVIIGCVVGLVVCIVIVLLIMLLLWYKRKRIHKDVNSVGPTSVVHITNHKATVTMDDGKVFSDHQFSALNHQAVHSAESNNFLGTIKNISPYDAIDTSHTRINYNYADSSESQVREPVPYSEPNVGANSVKHMHHSKLASKDYESFPKFGVKQNLVREYETIEAPYQVLEDPKQIVYENSMKANDVLSKNDQVYEDPGHKKEVIYSWFEKKKFRKIKKENIRLLQQLGAGEFGIVHLGLLSNGSADPVQVAVKTLNSQCSESDRVKFLREAAIMGQFVHNNVVQLHGVVTEEENIMIVLEYMPKGDLQGNLISLKTTISQVDRHDIKCCLLRFCRQIAAGMNYLANKQFVHRDLAARNILVSSDDVCKIADFGMARDVANDTYYITSGGKIPLKWTAPEAIFYKKYSTQSDVWSFGCVMYEIWSLGRRPFEDIDDGTEYIETITTGYRLPPPPGCPRAMYELMIQCWHPVAKQRPLPHSIHQTLQRFTDSLPTSSADDVNSALMLGEPLVAGSQLYLDLQHMYMTKSAVH